MIQHIYGTFSLEQFESYKVKLHKELFWLLVYKDPKTENEYKHVNLESYFDNLLRKFDGLNEILSYPYEIISIMSVLQAALIESRKDDFDYHVYRKLVLDAHSLVDQL